jgi:hypothetical protein
MQGEDYVGSAGYHQVRAEALEVLRDVLEWRTTSENWDRIARALETMAAAIVKADLDALQVAADALELMSPIRIIRIGDVYGDPPPETVRDRVNRLVHSLESPEASVHDESS